MSGNDLGPGRGPGDSKPTLALRPGNIVAVHFGTWRDTRRFFWAPNAHLQLLKQLDDDGQT
jgi:hypothetical protein